MNVLYNNCNVHIHDLPDMNALIPPACSPRDLVYISGKSLMPMLQLLCVVRKCFIICWNMYEHFIFFVAMETTLLIYIQYITMKVIQIFS